MAEIKYNNNVIASLEAGKTVTLPCAGKKMKSDIVVTTHAESVESGGINVDNMYTLSNPVVRGKALGYVLNDVYYTFGSDEMSPGFIPSRLKCTAIIIDDLNGLDVSTVTIEGTLVTINGTAITASNISSHFGEVLILESDVTIRGIF